jgi:hypothetical protein
LLPLLHMPNFRRLRLLPSHSTSNEVKTSETDLL